MIQQPTAISVLLRLGGISAILAGGLFFLTVIYAFGFMSSLGFTQECSMTAACCFLGSQIIRTSTGVCGYCTLPLRCFCCQYRWPCTP